ncbi:MAG: hypothetical protein HC880_05395 [Bacteroidia bacterium]|nr:hypothetical protein [Bacteroidia bacterium]
MKKRHLTRFVLGILAIILLNVLFARYFFRIDLTEEQRYTLAPATKNLLRNLDKDLHVKVYLAGDIPNGFKPLQRAVRETLDEFQVYAGNKLTYSFLDPTGVENTPEAQATFYQELMAKGIVPNNIVVREGQGRVEKLVFPGALISCYDKESGAIRDEAVPLFKTVDQRVLNLSPEQILNQSLENTEFNLISGIKKLASRSDNG